MREDQIDDYIEELKEIEAMETLAALKNNYVDNKTSPSPTCWGSLPDEEFVPSFQSIEKVPSGVYEMTWNRDAQKHTLKKQPFKTDELYHLPSPEITDILQDIDNFWNRVDKYKQYNFVHKRGILMYGDPGCGKSGIIQLISQKLIERDGIVINVKDEDDVDKFTSFIGTFRKVEPNRPIVVLLEDIDSIASENRYQTARLLNILDGVKQIEGVVYIATTNYPEKLQERITNRPSRFDRRYYIAPPSEEVRKAYLQNKIGKSKMKIDIAQWVKDTEGLSMSHLKELFISVVVLDNDYGSAIDHLKGLKKAPRNKSQKGLGFSN